jgi:hypothetical protein
MDLVLPFNLEENEFKGMSHEMLALLKEYIHFSTTSIVASIASFAHILSYLLFIVRTPFNYGVDFLLSNSRIVSTFSLSATCRSTCCFVAFETQSSS